MPTTPSTSQTRESKAREGRRNFLKASFGSMSLAAIVGCLGGSPEEEGEAQTTEMNEQDSETTTPNELTTIKYATAAGGVAEIQSNIIKANGIDEKYGLNLDLNAVAPPKAPQLLVNKAVEASLFSVQAAAVANTEGKHIRIYAPGLHVHLSLMTSGDYTELADLEGEKIGVLSSPSGTWNQTNQLWHLLGYDLQKDFEVVQGGPGAIHSQDIREDVEAHTHFPPSSVRQIVDEDGPLTEVFRYSELFERSDVLGRNPMLTGYSVHEEFLRENPETVKALRSMKIEADQYLRNNAFDALKEHIDLTGYETDAQLELAAEITKTQYPGVWGQEKRQQVVEQLELSKEIGLIPNDAPTDQVVVGEI